MTRQFPPGRLRKCTSRRASHVRGLDSRMDRFQTEAAVLTVFLQPCAHLRSFIIIVFAKRENVHLFSRCRVHIRPDHAVTEKQRCFPVFILPVMVIVVDTGK